MIVSENIFLFLLLPHPRPLETCKKTPCYSMTQFAGGLLLKKLKYFEVVLNIFEFSQVSENVEY